MTCLTCGGTMIGDGYTEPVRCENVDIDEIIDREPDGGAVYCKETWNE